MVSGGLGGGGIEGGGDPGRQTLILDNVVANNSMFDANGGGISIFSAGSILIQGNIIRSNYIFGGFPCSEGGGLHVSGDTQAEIVQNLIVENTGECGGGLVLVHDPSEHRDLSISSPTLGRVSTDRGDDDGGDERPDTVEVGIAFRQDVDHSEVVLAEQISQPTEAPAQDHHIGSGEGEREFLRRRGLVTARVGIGFQDVINQLAGLKTVASVFIQMELDAGAILA